MPIKATLKKVTFFNDLNDEQLKGLAQSGKIVALEAHQIVIREGEEAPSLYVILAGRVRVSKCDESGNEVELDTRGEGEFFGELALLGGGTRSATVSTLTPCEFFTLDQPAFITLVLHASSHSVFRVFSALAKRAQETSQKLFRQELARRALQAEMEIARHRSIAQLVTGVAHELNTPLGIISTAANLIKKRLTSDTMTTLAQAPQAKAAYEDIVEASALIERSITRADKLVQDFKKVSVNQITDTKQRLKLVAAVAETVDLFKVSARQAKLDIAIRDTLPAQETVWWGYPGSLSQVILNLLTNIQRYAYPDGTGGKVEIVLVADQGEKDPCFRLTVRDFGQGISPENLPRVFDTFFTTGRGKGGTGLGMAIVHNIVTELLKGTIAIESAPGAGTKVTLTFPQIIPDRLP